MFIGNHQLLSLLHLHRNIQFTFVHKQPLIHHQQTQRLLSRFASFARGVLFEVRRARFLRLLCRGIAF